MVPSAVAALLLPLLLLLLLLLLVALNFRLDALDRLATWVETFGVAVAVGVPVLTAELVLIVVEWLA